MATKIKSVRAIEILDSRGIPTIKTTVIDDHGNIGWASVPSGASTGKHEAVELRDGDKQRFFGKGVSKAIANVVETIAPKINGLDPLSLKKIDEVLIALDGTEDKSNLGANSILSVSLACARLAATSSGKELFTFLNEYYFSKFKPGLPLPFANVLNGGKHAINSTDIQEFMIVPLTPQSFSESYRMVSEIYHALKKQIQSRGLSTTVGDEGGFAPGLPENSDALELLLEAIKAAGYKPGVQIGLAIDAAADSFYKDGQYFLASEERTLTPEQFVEYFVQLASDYPMVSIEDPFEEEDWKSFASLTKQIGQKVQIVGDDLYVTNTKRLEKGIENNATNSILVKPNQIGTISETVASIQQAYAANFTVIISHRSGETADSFIADLATSCRCGQIKTGAPARGERTAKYNRLVEIEKSHPDIPLVPFAYHAK